MKSTNQPPAIRVVITLALIASLSAGVLVSGLANTHVKAGNRKPVAQPAKRVATSFPNLQRFAVNLTKLARLGKIQAVIGYDAEIGRVVETLANSTITPVLVGESNLERTAVARGLALRIASGNVPAGLRKDEIFSLNFDAIASEAKTSQEFENRVQAIIAETAKANGRVVLFIDELQEVTGKRATYMASSTLSDALRSKSLRVIGATSPEAYDEYIASDKNLAGLFEAVVIGETADTTSVSSRHDEQQNAAPAEAFEGDKISPDMRELMQSASADGQVTAILQVNKIGRAHV